MFLALASMAQERMEGEQHFKKAEAFKKAALSDSAILYYEKSAAIFKETNHQEGLLSAYNQLGILLTRQDKYEPAKFYLQEAMRLGDSTTAANSLQLATTYLNLGVVHSAQKNYIVSLDFHNKSLALRQRLLGEYSAEVATNYGNIGNVHFRMQDFVKAIQFHEKARQIREQIFGRKSVEIIESYTNLGNAYRENKQYAEALQFYELALANKILQRGEGHKDLQRFYSNVSVTHYAMGNKAQGDLFKQQAEGL